MWWPPIVVALIAGPLMWFLQRRDLRRLDDRNTSQHATSMNLLSDNTVALRAVHRKLDRVEDKVDRLDVKVDRLDERVDRLEVSEDARRPLGS